MNLKSIVFCLVLIIVVLGSIVPFFAQFVLPSINKSISPAGAEVWNQYVSIILGVVATLLSVVSLFLCFRSEDRTKESNNQLNHLFEKLSEKIDKVGEHQRTLEMNLTHMFSQKTESTQIAEQTGTLSTSSPSVAKDESPNI